MMMTGRVGPSGEMATGCELMEVQSCGEAEINLPL